jgi:uncharacterized membrane protein YozB (DUF420 family)
MDLQDLPAVNACLNGLSMIFLSAGFVLIRRGRELGHRRCMMAALTTSALFLVFYLTYHFVVRMRTSFVEPAWFRPTYLAILISHTVLAPLVVPLALRTVYLGLRGRREQHRRWARWTWPVWMYVSVTGVAIYLILYRIFPQASSG